MNQPSSSVAIEEPPVLDTKGVTISGEVHRRAKIYAAAHGITLFELLNEAVTKHLDERQDQEEQRLRG